MSVCGLRNSIHGRSRGIVHFEHGQTSLTCLHREGYRSAAGFLAHVKEVKDDLEAIIKQVGKERVKVSRVANSLQISVQI